MRRAQRIGPSASLTRRGFLVNTALAAGGAMALPMLVPGSALGADGKVAPSERIGIGFIGLGRQAIHANMSVFLRSGYCQTVALCDVDRWRLNVEAVPQLAKVAKKNEWDPALLKDTFRTTDFRELLAHKRVDAVMISTPDHWHVPIALAAIKAGKDVDLEKPIGLAISHGRVLADAAAKAKTVFRTDSNFRSEPELFRAVSLVRTGKIGKLKTIRISVPIYPSRIPDETLAPVPADLDYEMWQGPAERRPYVQDRVHPPKEIGRPGWYNNRLYCDGLICNWGHHPADLAQWANDTELTGPVEVEGRGDLPPEKQFYNVMGEFKVHYRYANGVEMDFIGRKDYKEGESYMRFEGTEGWVCAWRAPQSDRGPAPVDSQCRGQVRRIPVLAQEREDRLHRMHPLAQPNPGGCRSGPSLQHRSPARIHCLSARSKAYVGPCQGSVSRRRRSQQAGSRTAGASPLDHPVVSIDFAFPPRHLPA